MGFSRQEYWSGLPFFFPQGIFPTQGLNPSLPHCRQSLHHLSHDYGLTKQETLLGRGARVESQRVREPRRIALPCGSQSRVLWWWDSFSGCLWPIILTHCASWWPIHCSDKMDSSKEDSRRWEDMWHLLLTFRKFFMLLVACLFRVPYQDLLSYNNSHKVTVVPGQGG